MSNACDVTKETCTASAVSTAGAECCDIPEKLLCLADEAWKEVLKEKIKQEIEKSSGPKLSALAKLVAETNQRRWSHLIEGRQKCDEYKQQVKEVLLGLNQ